MRGSPAISRGAAIVKLGGSLAKSGTLRKWLGACRKSPAPVIIVPGGGPFADTVREAQSYMGFDDRTAHRMALLAMAQYAEALSQIEPGFVIASEREDLLAAVNGPATAIWSPVDILDGAPGVEENWEFTSDSLAAWLALELGVKILVLVKSAPPPAKWPSLTDTASDGIVDPVFPRLVDGSGLRIVWLGPSNPGELYRALEPRDEVATTETHFEVGVAA